MGFSEEDFIFVETQAYESSWILDPLRKEKQNTIKENIKVSTVTTVPTINTTNKSITTNQMPINNMMGNTNKSKFWLK